MNSFAGRDLDVSDRGTEIPLEIIARGENFLVFTGGLAPINLAAFRGIGGVGALLMTALEKGMLTPKIFFFGLRVTISWSDCLLISEFLLCLRSLIFT